MFRMKDKTLSSADKSKVYRNAGTYGVLLAVLGAMTFLGVCDPTSRFSGGGPKGAAAVIGSEVVSRAEFDRAYRMAYSRYQQQFSDQFDPAALRLAETVMRGLVDDRVMYLSAAELGLKASDDEVMKLLSEAEVFKDEKGQFSEETFKNYLRYNGHSEASFMEEVRRNVTVQKLRRFVTDTTFVSSKAAELDYKLNETKMTIDYLKFDPQLMNVSVTPEETTALLNSEDGKKRIKEYYDTNNKEFNQEEQLKARHILVSYNGARNATADAAKRTKEEAKLRAEEVLGKLKAPGADFAAVARDMTDEASGKSSGGDLGWFSRDAMVKEFSDAAFTLEPGALSGVVESPFGFHVIKVEEKKAAKNVPLEQAQQQIAENLIKREKRPKIAKEKADLVLAELKKGPVTDDFLKEQGVQWQSTGAVPAVSRFLPGIGSSKEVGDALASLHKPGQMRDSLLDVRGNYYVLKLKDLSIPDMTKLDADKRREMTMSAAYSEGFALFSSFEKKLREDMQKKGKVWTNTDYFALDTNNRQQG